MGAATGLANLLFIFRGWTLHFRIIYGWRVELKIVKEIGALVRHLNAILKLP